jgi:hypothetical protein
VTEPASPGTSFPDAAVDSLAAALLAGFVGLLFLGYFDPGFPYSGVATIPLLGSLAILFWTNRRADRIDRSALPAPDP